MPTALLPLGKKACCGFYRHKSPSPSAGIEPSNLRSYNKYVSYYTTEEYTLSISPDTLIKILTDYLCNIGPNLSPINLGPNFQLKHLS